MRDDNQIIGRIHLFGIMWRLVECKVKDMDTLPVPLGIAATKILQKSGIQKNEVIELIYRGFI